MSNPVILCVDDEKIVLNGLKEQLKSKLSGYSIETAESGMEALELLLELVNSNIEVPLVITDYIMPGMKGDELLSKIHTFLPKTIKIMLTGQATMDGVTNAVNQANLYHYIAKPWEKEDLCLTVRQGLNSYYKDRQLEIQTQKLKTSNEELVSLTEAFVEAMVTAMDTRDSTTAGHSKRLAGYAVNLAKAINSVNYGMFKDFSFSDIEIRELYYASLLHDIGKIGVRENILLKERKLSNNRILSLKYKFNYIEKSLELKSRTERLSPEEQDLLENIYEYLNFIILINSKNYVTDEQIRMIEKISKINFTNLDGASETLLDEFEVKNLTVLSGNLNKEERKVINSHAEQTHKILRGIPWTKDLKNVPEIAASHHEKVDGSGYYRGLKGPELSVQARMLAILDIFEALTAQDRPYRRPMSINSALDILQKEVDLNHLDKDIYEIFIREKLYNLYKDEIENIKAEE